MSALGTSTGKMFLQSSQYPVGSENASIGMGTITECQNDFTLGPFVSGCRGDFDFTLLFQHLILSVIPSVCFLVLSLHRIWRLHRSRVVIRGNFLSLSKFITISLLSAVNLGLVLLIPQQTGEEARQAALASLVLAIVNGPVMAYLSHLEHHRSLRTSILLNSYLALTIPFSAIRTRTTWMVFGNQSYSIMFTTATALSAALAVLEAMPKLRWLNSTPEQTSPEEISGIYSLLFMSWVNPLLRLGNQKVLDTTDLYPLDSRLSAAVQSETFQKEFRRSQHLPKRNLALILFKALSWSFLQSIPSRLAMVAFSFGQPFFIGSLIRYLESDSLSNRNTGLGLVLASLLIYPGLALSSSSFSWLHSRAVSKARSALVTAIYRKTIELNSTHLDTNILTLMSTDVERIVEGELYPIHDVWANTVEIILASFFLQRQLGSAFIAPILVVSASVVSTSFIAKFTGPAMSKWTQSTEARVRLTTAVVSSMKSLKISGLSEAATGLLQKSREDEQRVGSAYRILLVVSITSAFTPMFLAPVATFFWAGRQLSMAEVFSSLSYVALITSPLTQLFQKVPGILASFACLTTIQNFLDTEVRSEYRLFQGDTAESDERHVAISFESASLGWTQDQRQLQGLNLKIPKSGLTIVTGPVASGKSTLCKALLGEVPFIEGTVTFHQGFPRIGYCDQTPFLVNGSIRSNIIGFELFDGKLYDEVLDTVMLKDDLDSLPNADSTPIGSSGISLSGGQKQRVGLARALYLGADFYVLDDCTVGLDKLTADTIVSRLFGPGGFLHRRKATTVWCTHSVQYLPYAQNVIALSTDGRVAYQGQPEDILSDEQSTSAVENDVNKSNEDTAPDSKLSLDADSKSGHEDEKDPTRSLNDSSVYTHYFSSFGPLLISVVLLSALSWGFFWNAGTLFLKYWADNSFHIPGSQSHINNVYLGIYAILQLSGIMTMGLYVASTDMGMARVGGSVLHLKAVKALMAAPLQYFTKTDQGVTINLFSQDINLVDFFLPKSMSNTLLAFFASAGEAVVVAIGTPFVALAYPILLIFLSLLSRFYLRTSRQLRLLDLEALSPLYAQFQDTIRGIATIRASGWVPHYTAQNHARVDDSLRPAYLLSVSQVWLMLVLKLVVASVAVSVTVLATQVISLSGRAGFVGAGMVSLMELGNMMNACVHSWIHLEMSLGAVKRLKDFGEKAGREGGDGEDLRPGESWPEKGEILIDGVDASYEEERYRDGGEHRALALKNIQMNIQAGEKVAIIGRTGSGKSSLILLLLRLLEPTSETAGNITIDGTQLRKLHRNTLRQRVIAMPQDMVYLAGGESFRTALDPYCQNTDDDCQFALEQVGLWSVVHSAGGLQVEMTKEVFSQGQKQMFSLAIALTRARLRQKHGSKSGILLLDEVTASVDRETEQIMTKVIHQNFADYTVMAVTHSLESVASFDRIIVMGNGQVAKDGTPYSFSQEQESVAS